MVVAASDYLKALPDSLSQWLNTRLVALGTDGFGRSDTREALREFFEVDARFITVATLRALARRRGDPTGPGRAGDRRPWDRPGEGGPDRLVANTGRTEERRRQSRARSDVERSVTSEVRLPRTG